MNIPILAPGSFTALDGQRVEVTEGGLVAIEADMAGRGLAGDAASADADASVPLNLEHNCPRAWAQAPVPAHEGRQAEAPAATRAVDIQEAQPAAGLPPPQDPIGAASGIRYDPLRRQLLADLEVTDGALNAAIAAGRYQGRSAELELCTSAAGHRARLPDAGRADRATETPVRLTGLALLDALSPAVPGLGGLGRGRPEATRDEGRQDEDAGEGARAPSEDGRPVGRPCRITRDATQATHHISIYGGT